MEYIARLIGNYKVDGIKASYNIQVTREFQTLDRYFVFEASSYDAEKVRNDYRIHSLIEDQEEKLTYCDWTPEISISQEDADNAKLSTKPLSTNPAATVSTHDPEIGDLVTYWPLEWISQRVNPQNKSGFYNYSQDGSGVDLYIIDSGIQSTHPYLAGRVNSVPGTAFDGIGNEDGYGHGTDCALFAGGIGSGVAQGVQLWACKIFDDSGSATTADIIQGMDAVITHHNSKSNGRPSVVNMSFASTNPSDSLNFVRADDPDAVLIRDEFKEDISKEMVAAGMHCFIAAGNGFGKTGGGIWGPYMSTYQSHARVSAYADTITVGATNRSGYATPNNNMATFSNYGAANTLQAPGASMYRKTITGGWSTTSGTSFASPTAAGVACLWLNALPNLTPAELKQKMIDTASDNLIFNIGAYTSGKHEFSDGVLAWGGNLTMYYQDGTPSHTIDYNDGTDIELNTPNKFLFQPWQDYVVSYDNPTTNISMTTSDALNIPHVAHMKTSLWDEEPFACTYTLENAPAWISINNTTGVISGTPPSSILGETFTFDVISTNEFQTDTRTYTVNVTRTNVTDGPHVKFKAPLMSGIRFKN